MSAEAYLPDERSDVEVLRAAAARCRGCDLWARATATVFGVGPQPASLLLVGEQPGDREDRVGAPFVGPAGRLLDTALATAGIDRQEVYLTNAVKHFKWAASTSGTRRLHKKPSAREVSACRPWLRAEIDAVAPRLIVCLGATAAQALLGNAFRLSAHRGEVLDSDAGVPVTATIHPSAVLRGRPAERDEMIAGLVADLRVAASSAG